jgi:predicted dehydrogenase/aryl-alcohol dehydrogenase-like predicted oxidoreductase
MGSKLKWGIIGTGNIAKAFAKGVAKSQTGEIVAVGSRSRESADKFADEFKIGARHASYDALLADKNVQAVYIATPHPLHAEWAVKSAEAGKHILCEKPLGINQYQVMAIVEAARKHNVFLMEAYMYRCQPQTRKLLELIREKVIGEVRVIQAAFSFNAKFNPAGRLFSNDLAGGGILDVGGYCASLAGLVAGAAQGKEGIAEALDLKALGCLGETGVDHYTVATVSYPGNILAQLSTGIQVNQENVVRIFGSEGQILAPSPWLCSRHGEPTKIIITKAGKPSEEITVESGADLYSVEADTVAANLERRQAAYPAMTPGDSLINMRVMDLWRGAIGLVYNCEKSDAVPTVHRRPLAVDSDHNMKYGKIPGLDKPVSRVIMGADHQKTMVAASGLFDYFFERGGNCIDVAYHYGNGHQEKVLGQHIKNRGIRKQIVILGKGAHTPNCNPKAVTQQLLLSLENLQTDHLDIYMLHRDNPDIPVSEFVDVLNEHKRAGRIKVFGGSNWSIQRVEQANAYAKSKNLEGFTSVGNNFSLARMVNPVWGGCIAASDPESRAWFAKTQMALLPWSSQARGFFTERASPANLSDKEMVNSWYSEDNWKRRERVLEMARKRNVLPINIALAYVLCQPFPTFPLIGPRTIEETRTSLLGLDLLLTPQELRWLNLED